MGPLVGVRPCWATNSPILNLGKGRFGGIPLVTEGLAGALAPRGHDPSVSHYSKGTPTELGAHVTAEAYSSPCSA